MAGAISKRLGLALFGLGRAGRFHLQSIQCLPDVRLRAVVDADRQRQDEVAAEFGCLSPEHREQALSDPHVDAVIVATPTQTHFEAVVAALSAGKAVLSEKPLGVNLEQIDLCYELARAQGRPLMTAFQRRFDPSFAALVEAVHAGQIGQLQFVRSVSRDNPVPSLEYIRTSHGIFHDCLVHDLDMIVHIAREIPSHVCAFGSSFIPEIGGLGDWDNVAVSLRFPSGVIATVDVNRKSVYGYDQRIEAFGSWGMLQADNPHRHTVLHATETALSRSPIEFSFPTRYREAYLRELMCFVECVRDGREAPVTHDQVRWNHRLADAAERSAREGRVVEVSGGGDE
jgi:myo-inositol 2-dehydrogenase/D-chiro-inositol 1-dehydrogenase